MYIIRPVALKDADAFETLAFADYLGMTAVSLNKRLLLQEVRDSLDAFSKEISQPKDENYLFVLEDIQTGEIGGCCGIHSRTGVESPDYYYKIESLQTEYLLPGSTKELQVLKVVTHRNGPTKICGLYMAPGLRKQGLGHLLSLCRFLFIAAFPNRFTETIIADMRGVINENGVTPFWNALGRHFLNIEYKDLMRLQEEGKEFIPKILPQFPIYTFLLPEDVRSLMGQTHMHTKAALQLLTMEGFNPVGEIDVFDAGPKISAVTNEIRIVRTSIKATVRATVPRIEDGEDYLIGNERLDFRVCTGKVRQINITDVAVTEEVAYALNIYPGQQIRYVTQRAT